MELTYAIVASLAFMAILFTQSGLDKVFDFHGNMEWLKGHFGSSPLASVVKPMVVLLTLMELASGLFSIVAVVYVLGEMENAKCVANIAFGLCSASFLALFFGQRMAKDYAGAASLPSYFIIPLIGFVLLYLLG